MDGIGRSSGDQDAENYIFFKEIFKLCPICIKLFVYVAISEDEMDFSEAEFSDTCSRQVWEILN